jgi:membrane protein
MRGIFSFFKYYYVRYKTAEIQTKSAALAFHTILIIVPVIGIVFWYLKVIGISGNWFNLIRLYLLTQINLAYDSNVIRQFDRMTATVRGNSWGFIGIAIFIYTFWNLLDKFGKSLDVILDTSREQHNIVKRSFLELVAWRTMAMLGLPIALAVSLMVTNWIKKDSWLRYLIHLKTVGPFFALPLAWGVDIVVLFLIYCFIPRSSVPWRQAFKVAVFVGPLSEIMRYIFGYYSKHAIIINKIYGIFVAIPLFILWVQLTWMIILMGALAIRFGSADGHKAGAALPENKR